MDSFWIMLIFFILLIFTFRKYLEQIVECTILQIPLNVLLHCFINRDCSPMARETRFDPRSSHTKNSRNTQHYKVWIKGKVEQTRERSSAFLYTVGVNEKGAFEVALDYSHQLTFIYIYSTIWWRLKLG